MRVRQDVVGSRFQSGGARRGCNHDDGDAPDRSIAHLLVLLPPLGLVELPAAYRKAVALSTHAGRRLPRSEEAEAGQLQRLVSQFATGPGESQVSVSLRLVAYCEDGPQEVG